MACTNAITAYDTWSRGQPGVFSIDIYQPIFLSFILDSVNALKYYGYPQQWIIISLQIG